MNIRTAAMTFTMVILTLPIFAQEAVSATPPETSGETSAETAPPTTVSATSSARRVTSDSTTTDRLAKFDGSGNVTDSVLAESSGKIGLGTTTPTNALHIVIPDGSLLSPLKLETSGVDSVTGLSLKNDARTVLMRLDGTDGDKFKIFDSSAGVTRLAIDPTYGYLGIGTADPKAMLHVYGGATNDVFMGLGPDPSAAGPGFNIGYAGFSFGRSSAFFNVRPDALAVAPNPSIRFMTANIERMIITNTGAIGIGVAAPLAKLHVDGNIIATGSITGATVIGAVYQDVAEWVPATTDMLPGTVVVLNPERRNEVMSSSRSYDSMVAGVVSTQPGILLGTAAASKEQIATTGRVPVRVDATAGPIRIGDLLVTGNIAGTAMKSVPVEIAGVAMHRPGTIIGKALEPLDEGVGEILVLLSLQ